jgi:hypothetical protein
MMVADNGSGIEVTSDTAVVLLKDGARGGYELQYEPYADALHHLGLFNGSDKGYELERSPSRQESLIMLIRLLGEESAALVADPITPFSDLTDWVDGQRYVAYGYRMHYTNGTSNTTFSPTAGATLEQYLTFVLRSLGYKDGVDFQWDSTSRDLAAEIGLLSREELSAIARDGFKRDHVVAISYRALDCDLQNGSGTLADRLVDAGVVNGIGATVAHIDDGCPFSANQHRYQSGAHAGELFKLTGLVINRKVCQFHRIFQNIIHIGLAGISGPGLFDLLDEYIRSQGAGNITGFCAAHTVAHHAKERVFIQLFDQVCILILRPGTAKIC